MVAKRRSQDLVWSRGAIACNGCRTRKQKCGGERPACARCRAISKPCIWPEQHKRGPAKGYTESLENRLHQTETVLLRLLSVVSDQQLSTALEASKNDSRYSNGIGLAWETFRTKAEERRKVVECWTSYPLRTASDVKVWQNERVRNSSLGFQNHRKEGTSEHESSEISEVAMGSADCFNTGEGSVRGASDVTLGSDNAAATIEDPYDEVELGDRSTLSEISEDNLVKTGIGSCIDDKSPIWTAPGRMPNVELESNGIPGEILPTDQGDAITSLGFSKEFQKRYLW